MGGQFFPDNTQQSGSEGSNSAEEGLTNSDGNRTPPISVPSTPRARDQGLREEEWGPYGIDSENQSGRLAGSGFPMGGTGKNGMAP